MNDATRKVIDRLLSDNNLYHIRSGDDSEYYGFYVEPNIRVSEHFCSKSPETQIIIKYGMSRKEVRKITKKAVEELYENT